MRNIHIAESSSSSYANVPSSHPFPETMAVKSHGALLPEMMATRGGRGW